jgi:hypothetical protein
MLAAEPGLDDPGRYSQEAVMDAGLTIKPVAGVAVTDYTRPTAAVVAGSIVTDLPDNKTVSPAAGTTPARNDTAQPETSNADYITHNVTIDPQSREVIYRVIDSRTRQVIQQVPDETLLRNQAYSKAIATGASPFDALSKADLEA